MAGLCSTIASGPRLSSTLSAAGSGMQTTLAIAVATVLVTSISSSCDGAPRTALTQSKAALTSQSQAQVKIAQTVRSAGPGLVSTVNLAVPGSSGGAPAARALRTDFTDLRYWYVEYASRIKRLDQSVSPAAVGFAAGAWADRAGLGYA